MKVLVLGATGLLGTHLSKYLKKRDVNIVTHGFSKNADFNIDLRNSESCYNLLDTVNPDFIINTIALTNVDKCEAEPLKAFELNTKIVENIKTYLENNNSSSLIHISTDMVYDGEGINDEKDAKPQNVYALTKYCAEKEALLCKGVVLRTNFFGNSGQDKRKTSFNDWIINSVRKRKDINFISDVYFSPLHLDTLVKKIYKVLDNPVSGIYNLGSKDGLSKSEFARKVCDIYELDASYVEDISVDSLCLEAFRPKQMKMKVKKFETTYKEILPSLSDEIKKLN